MQTPRRNGRSENDNDNKAVASSSRVLSRYHTDLRASLEKQAYDPSGEVDLGKIAAFLNDLHQHRHGGSAVPNRRIFVEGTRDPEVVLALGDTKALARSGQRLLITEAGEGPGDKLTRAALQQVRTLRSHSVPSSVGAPRSASRSAFAPPSSADSRLTWKTAPTRPSSAESLDIFGRPAFSPALVTQRLLGRTSQGSNSSGIITKSNPGNSALARPPLQRLPDSDTIRAMRETDPHAAAGMEAFLLSQKSIAEQGRYYPMALSLGGSSRSGSSRAQTIRTSSSNASLRNSNASPARSVSAPPSSRIAPRIGSPQDKQPLEHKLHRTLRKGEGKALPGRGNSAGTFSAHKPPNAMRGFLKAALQGGGTGTKLQKKR